MTSDSGEANLAVACALADELGRQGVHHVVICPGSRSTPVAVALTAHADIETWVLIDERAAAFFALGIARQINAPVALLCTSGTAAANFLPAIAEARLSRVPLIALTADRPPELRGWGAAQTIDQPRLYGDHVKWFADMPVPFLDEALIRQTRASAARAIRTARSEPPGPVHLNLPCREPLLPPDLRPPLRLGTLFQQGRSNGSAVCDHPIQRVPSDETSGTLASLIAASPRGIIVCGPGESPGLASAVTTLSELVGYPVLADPLSGVRFGAHDRSHVIDSYDPFLRHEAVAAQLRPEIVIRIGAIPTSKPLQQFLMSSPGYRHIVIDPGDPRDPSHLATWVIAADAAATLASVTQRLSPISFTPDSNWFETWRAVDTTTREAISIAIAGDETPFEGRAVAEVAALLPAGSTLVAGNSMPVRDIDAFVRGDRRDLKIVGNRGANGIDGMNSSALGAAAVAGGPVVLVVGDLSYFHDLNGLLAARKFGLDATIVVLNNDGGGIFSFLPQAEQLDEPIFESLFGTPTGLDVAKTAELFGAAYACPDNWSSVRRDVCRSLYERGLSIVEIVTDRERNVAQHRAIWKSVGDALEPLLAGES